MSVTLNVKFWNEEAQNITKHAFAKKKYKPKNYYRIQR